ncbi:MAG: DUF418 domain-containing protein [Chitinophagaceae bacterium]|nr:DUF418 domain-containing protein [Chitinophagaceae bacterium]
MSSTSPGPSGYMPVTGISAGDEQSSSRIFSLDVLRGIALLGILIISIWEFGGFSTNQQTFYRTGTHGGNYNLLSFVTIVFEGKMRALFSIVFGACIILYISKKDHPLNASVPDLYIRRMLWLMIFGIFNAIVLLWPGDILFHYAVLGILLFPFWRMKPKSLFIAAIITTLIYCGKTYWNFADDSKKYRKFTSVTAVEKKFAATDTPTKKIIDSLLKIRKNDPLSNRLMDDTLLQRHKNDTLTKEQAKDKQAWEGLVKSLKYDSTGDDGNKKAMRSTNYAKVWNHLLGKSQNYESYWLYRTGIWDIGSMMFLGMALLGFGFFAAGFPVKRLLWIVIPCILAGLALAWFRNYYEDIKLTDYAKYMDKHIIPFDQFFPVERFLLATGYAGLIILLLNTGILKWLWQTLAITGRMAFTNYFMQTILCTVFFYGYGMGFFGRLSQLQLYGIVVEVWLIQIAFSLIWSKYFVMGPVEWLWRSLVHWKKQPFTKKETVTGATGPVIS